MTERHDTPEQEQPAPRSRRRFTVDSLFSDTRPRSTGVTDLQDAKEIRLDRIVPDPDQPRRMFDQDRLDELAASIRTDGVLQPIVVRYDEPEDRYIIVHGERRWRASSLAGRETVPALIRDVPAERRLLQQLMENVVRDDLNAVDRANALRTLRSQLGDPAWEVVAEAVGIKRSRLFQLLGTGKLS
ncbi:MAG TPA: ParB/RepB/Spo0J family partition protein, partial [Thermomicrobiales bacterium]|nr:ParB/RepB/Spo0J family partition protein [Thermomicrobiales bacterium]